MMMRKNIIRVCALAGMLFGAATLVAVKAKKTKVDIAAGLVEGNSYTIGFLFDLINANNTKNKNSNFIILDGNASKSCGKAWSDGDRAMTVTLQVDNDLQAQNQAAGRSIDGQPMFYFDYNGKRMYIFDPHPPIKKKTAKSR